jgi:Calcineurin-like phosphoesterase/Secretion system C-terminal sorting domain/Purple acid Phosphatase, N-terminal domain/Putative metal-binding motif
MLVLANQQIDDIMKTGYKIQLGALTGMRCVFLTIFLLIAFQQGVAAQTVVRGPYILATTPNSTIIRWKTNSPTTSKVWYGNQPDNLNQWAFATNDTSEHELQITGLNPNTKYYYAVGNANEMLAGDTLDYYFKTHPVAGTKTSFHTLILGDQGTGYPEQFEVRDLYYAQEPMGETPFFITLGDNAYEDGELEEYEEFFFEAYAPFLRRTTSWVIPGNHDYHSCEPDDEEGPFFDLFNNPENGEAGGFPSASQRYYSFDYANVHFVVVEGYLPEGQLEWLAEDLAQTNQDWIIGLAHHPPYSKGNHDSDNSSTLSDVREQILPLFEAAGGDLFMSGHSHVYERSYLMHGHYGESNELEDTMIMNNGSGKIDLEGAYQKTSTGLDANKGTVYLVSGTSGGKESDGDLDHPIMYESFQKPGYGLLEIDDNRLDYTFYESNGVIRDYFTIIKELPPVPDSDQDGFGNNVDCNDNNAAVNPAAAEIPNNSVDENCDGITLIIDTDNDGFNSSVDCNDNNSAINPAAVEIPNNTIDENCDGIILIIDTDNDGFNSSVDCNDNNPAINPAAVEIPNNTIDENCDGIFLVIDTDNDGFNSSVDCNDNNPAINPAAAEIPNNTIDENCDGNILVIDTDNDGFNSSEDCNDNNPAINPAAAEIPNNTIDENCDGNILVIDTDNDGFNSSVDCNDNNPAINPAAAEIPNNTIDENCDGNILVIDTDNDGFNSSVDCNDNNPAINPAAAEIPNNTIDENCDGIILVIDMDNDGSNSSVDCDDFNPAINPAAVEIPNNTIDENCDGIFLYLDSDNDGFTAFVDCDDNNAAINPAAVEIPNNGIDENCDGFDGDLEIDADNDGFNAAEDCNDNNPDINPAALEIADNNVDENCDGVLLYSDFDQDGFYSNADCDDFDPNINPGATEIPNNSIDEDCDGIAQVIDADNDAAINPEATEIPNNTIDEDCDGQILVGLSRDLNNFSIKVYPNPADDFISVETTFAIRGEISVHNVMGKKVLTIATAGRMNTIDLSDLESGVYLLQVSDGEQGNLGGVVFVVY